MQSPLLQTLHELAPGGEAVALTRLAKRLDQRVSVLLRELTALSDASLGGVRGPGLVRLSCDDSGRWTVTLVNHP
jgi:DNA-binding transcriptional LysR family regulator